jgi:hypothetical protein
MGQSFVIAAPQILEILNITGKLGEILFDGTAESLVEFLAVPVRPKQARSVSKLDLNSDLH